MIYATHDNEGDVIAGGAHIRAFDTIEAAREWLLSPYSTDEWDRDSARIEPGGYSDCWLKMMDAPHPDSMWIAPFSLDQLTVLRPGQHPGGKFYWIEPKPDVLVVAAIMVKHGA